MSRPNRAPRRICGCCWTQRSRPISTRGLFIQQILETPSHEFIHSFACNVFHFVSRLSVEERLERFLVTQESIVGLGFPLVRIELAQSCRDFESSSQRL